jgi:hypothetical protein
MKILTIIILLFTMPLVAEWSDWSEEDKELFETLIILQGIDTHQTYTALKTGQFHESNPFYGTDPHIEEIILGKVLITAFLYKALDNGNRVQRNRGLKWANAVQTAVIIHNGKLLFNFKKEF